ncbi:MAG: ABC transporter permease [Ignavibacteriaceae bacterium]|nr:ABC transporter permease [Ignavibacteriaceae bacterium]
MEFRDIFLVSLQSLKSNRLRTFLTILGVVVGIFSIIVIMTIITMLQTTIETGVSFLNKNTFEIQKYPAIGGRDDYERMRNRKNIKLEDYYRFEKLLTSAKYVGAEQEDGGKVIKFRNKETNPNVAAVGITLGEFRTYNVKIESGREFIQADVDYSGRVCLLGHDVYEKLFNGVDPVGQVIRINEQPVKVAGLMEKRPQIFGQSQDNFVLLPISTFQSFYGTKNETVAITIQSYSDADYQSNMDASIGFLRIIRKVLPGRDNDFEIYSNETIMSQINNITGGVKIGAMVISIIALLAAGVGIMNIMLVSVTERTREIGIRKAVGARKKNILMQFLIEAVVLCLIGGLIGILLGVGVGNIAGSFLNADAVVPYEWIFIGLTMCVVVGVIFGTYPAYKAANLDPIEALRYE